MTRIQYIDIAKLIGLALVCFCHIPKIEGLFHMWVYSFHMPLFFILSGMFLKPEKVTLRNSIKQLLIPFIAFNLIALFLSFCINLLHTRALLFPKVEFNLLNSEYIVGPSWFLLSLFYLRLFCGRLLTLLRISGMVTIVAILFFIFYFTQNSKYWGILSIGSTLLGLPFYLLGFVAKDYILKYINRGGLVVTFILFALSCLSVFNGWVGIYDHSFGISLLGFLFFGIVGTIFLVRISRYLTLPQKILDTFMQGAIFYICMHTLMFEYIILLWNKLTNDFSGNTIIEKIIVTILTFVLSYPMIRFMLRYTPFLLGKQIRK